MHKFKSLRAVSVCFLCASMAFSTEVMAQSDDAMNDGTALSRYAIVQEDKMPSTASELEEMEATWRELLEQGNCTAALPLLADFADSANLTANIISQGIEPLYDASRDDSDYLMRNDRALVDNLVEAERFSNSLLRMRNTAWVEEAKCLISEGEHREAVNRLYRALDYIDARDEKVLWEEARTLLWEQVGYE